MKRTTLSWNKQELEEIVALSLAIEAELGATVKALVRYALNDIYEREDREEALEELKSLVSKRRKTAYEARHRLGL